jgi:hypothetical protein
MTSKHLRVWLANNAVVLDRLLAAGASLVIGTSAFLHPSEGPAGRLLFVAGFGLALAFLMGWMRIPVPLFKGLKPALLVKGDKVELASGDGGDPA